MKPQSVNLGDRLRALRLNSCKSQQAFADYCQLCGVPVTRDMVANWETCRAEMPAQLIPFIAYLLNAEVTDLLPNLTTPVADNLQRISLPFAPPAKRALLRRPKIKAPAAASQLAHDPYRSTPPAKARQHGTALKSVFLAENEMSPLDALMLSDTRAVLMTMIRTLDSRHRHPLLLHHYSGLKVRQIAAKLNLPVSNIQARLYRAYEKLRRLMNCDSQWRPLRNEFRDQFPPMEEP